MRAFPMIRCVLVSAAMTGILFPFSNVTAAQPATPSTPERAIVDVALGLNGELTGRVLDANGQAIKGTPVTVLDQVGRPLTRWPTDQSGQFVARNLTGGVHYLQTPNGLLMCRCWVANTAPPAAKGELLIIDDPTIARGQRPIGELMTPIVIGLLIAAAIAIPIAIHNSKDAS